MTKLADLLAKAEKHLLEFDGDFCPDGNWPVPCITSELAKRLRAVEKLAGQVPCTGYEPCSDSARPQDMWCERCRILEGE